MISVKCLEVQVRIVYLEFQQINDFQNQKVLGIFSLICHKIRFTSLFAKGILSIYFKMLS